MHMFTRPVKQLSARSYMKNKVFKKNRYSKIYLGVLKLEYVAICY